MCGRYFRDISQDDLLSITHAHGGVGHDAHGHTWLAMVHAPTQSHKHAYNCSQERMHAGTYEHACVYVHVRVRTCACAQVHVQHTPWHHGNTAPWHHGTTAPWHRALLGGIGEGQEDVVPRQAYIVMAYTVMAYR